MIKSHQMKPLFSKKDKDIYHPGDPRRVAFEEKLRSMGRNPKELEGKTIEVDNGGVAKVSLVLPSHLRNLVYNKWLLQVLI